MTAPAASPAPGRLLNVVTSTQRRGAETFACDLATVLSRRGRPAELVALTAAAEEAALAVPVLGRRALAPATLLALRRAGRGSAAVVAHGSRTLAACAVALAATGVPFAYRSIGDPAAWSATAGRRARTARLLRRARLVVVLWGGAADVLTTRHGVPSRKIRVVPNGVAADRCPVPGASERLEARRRWGLPEDAPVVACVGSLTAEKRVDHAIAAVGRLAGVHLVVAGTGPERAALEAHARRDVPGRVRFLGSLADVGPVLAAADVVVLASRTEGMPGVLIEAGLSERAVVAYDVGAVSEIVADGETGLLVAPGDVSRLVAALGRVLADHESMGSAARRRCLARFEIRAIADQWAAVIDEMVPD